VFLKAIDGSYYGTCNQSDNREWSDNPGGEQGRGRGGGNARLGPLRRPGAVRRDGGSEVGVASGDDCFRNVAVQVDPFES
jgi:hypothetical protein